MIRPKNLLDYAEWIGTITGVLGALIIASNIGFVGYAYIVFWFSAFCYMFFAWKLKRWPLFFMNCVFLMINFWGIWRWLLQPII